MQGMKTLYLIYYFTFFRAKFVSIKHKNKKNPGKVFLLNKFLTKIYLLFLLYFFRLKFVSIRHKNKKGSGLD